MGQKQEEGFSGEEMLWLQDEGGDQEAEGRLLQDPLETL